MLVVVPLTLKQANKVVETFHRHHKPVQGHKFSLGLVDVGADKLVGACIVGRPVARMCDQLLTCEVTRLVTTGEKNACSMLYGAAARVAKCMGYHKIQTYILDSEPGASLKAAGWVSEGVAGGGDWTRKGRDRRQDQPMERKQRWAKYLQ